jgi:rubredoxin
MADQSAQRYKCLNCGYHYDPAEGCPELDVPPGTAWEDLPEDWLCPQCGSDQRDFAAED